jgi:membrane-associated protein
MGPPWTGLPATNLTGNRHRHGCAWSGGWQVGLHIVRSMIAFLTPFLLVLGPIAVLVAMGIVFAETGLLLGFFLPGDSLLFTIGALAAGGLLHVPFLIVVLGLFVAAVAGDQMGYAVGRRLGSKVFTRADSGVFARSHRVAAERFFERHGPKAVVLARFVPVVRTFTPVVAGVGQMPRRQFTVFNVLGALAWTAGLLAVGRSILVIIWHLLADPETRFNDLGADHFARHVNTEAKKRNHVRQLEALGYRVTLESAA